MPRPPAAFPARPAAKDKYITRGLRIVHEDDDLIVIEKPPGMLSAIVPGDHGDNVFGKVKEHVKEAAKRRGSRAWIIHRLDREASGLLVFAKSERAYELLKEELSARRMHRVYAAVVEREFAPGETEGTIRSYLYEDTRGMIHSVESPGEVPLHLRRDTDNEEHATAKPATTHYRVLTQAKNRSLLHIRLETGRKHQIRVHLNQLGHSIIGDRRYGSDSGTETRLCLHAMTLAFIHPATGKEVRFESPIPPAMLKLLGIKDEGKVDFGQDVPLAGAPKAPPKLHDSKKAAPDKGWEHVAAWYDTLLEDRVSDHHERVILPGTVRLLNPSPRGEGDRILDVACGQGILCRRLADLGARVVGVDASPSLIERAKKIGGTQRCEYAVADARRLTDLNMGTFDAAACVMAIMNIEPTGPVFAGVAKLLNPGGRFVIVMLHPAFRSPGQTAWGWSSPETPPHIKGERRPPYMPPTPPKQFRRVDGYLSPGQREIIMNPGAVAAGKPPVVTLTFHRPIQTYITSLAEAGLRVDALEEWASVRTSQPGPKAAEENRARREIPMFLAIRAVKPS